MKAFTLADLQRNASPAFLRLNGSKPSEEERPALPAERQTRRALNKVEATFKRQLLDIVRDGTIIEQPTRHFQLTGGGTYTPDFLTYSPSGVDVWEVKEKGAHYAGWEQGYERYRRAALEHHRPWLRFHMAIFDRKKLTWDIRDWGGLTPSSP